MAWVEKDHPTPFDTLPIQGLFFLDGDVLARLFQRDWTANQKMPMIAFPSGFECQLWNTSSSEAEGIVHIFGELDLPYRDTRDEALKYATYVAEQCGYMVSPVGENQIEVWGHADDEHVLITYDNDDRRMVDIAPVETTTPPPRQPLLPDALREQLPPLYSNEECGLNAPAVVKFFTPDSNWTWYASEFDGKDTFFGLVVGFDVELGYFSLSELESVRGPLGLPIERDKYFEPTSLGTLQEQHRKDFLQ